MSLIALKPAVLSRNTDNWSTPQWLFDQLHAEFGFTLDAAASADNAKCPQYYSQEVDGLVRLWEGVVFVNPPFSLVSRFVRHGFQSVQETGAVVVMVVAARTDTRWWHDCVMQADEIRFLKGRLRYGHAENNSPFPSCVVVFRPHEDRVIRPLVTSIDASRRVKQNGGVHAAI